MMEQFIADYAPPKEHVTFLTFRYNGLSKNYTLLMLNLQNGEVLAFDGYTFQECKEEFDRYISNDPIIQNAIQNDRDATERARDEQEKPSHWQNEPDQMADKFPNP